MQFDYIAYLILLVAFGFVYISKFYSLKKANIVWVICTVLCLGTFILVISIRGGDLLNTALGLAIFAAAVFNVEGKSEGINAL